ncbi:MAG: MTH1187 family thiamine-binding protein [Armatimonadota bacterium]
MLASFAVIPVGSNEELKELVAEIIDIIDKSGLPYTLGAMQTTIEGNEDEVMALIMKCHKRMREMAPRVLTSITIDDRADANNRLKGKISDVEEVLGRNLSHE